MKNYNWIYFVLFLFLMQSCTTDDPRIEREYAIKNDSEVEVKINFLQSDMATLQSTIIINNCLLYTSPSPRDRTRSRMPSSA